MAHTLIGSGAEDVSAAILQESRARSAEDAARNRRILRDSIVAIALRRLEIGAYQSLQETETPVSSERLDYWLSGYLQANGADVRPEDIRALFAEIRGEFTPQTRELIPPFPRVD